MNTLFRWILIPSSLLGACLLVASICYKYKNVLIWVIKNLQLSILFKNHKPEIWESRTIITYKTILHTEILTRAYDNQATIKNICNLINQEMGEAMKNLRSNIEYTKLKEGNKKKLVRSFEKHDIFSLFDACFSEPLKLIITICPYLKKDEVYLLILFQTDLCISDIAPHLDVYDPKVLYQRKYRIKNKIRSNAHGIFVYAQVFKNK